MSPGVPIDQPEGERLEHKSLAALAEPDKIAREAVAMLNSQGGEVWIGIKEGQGRNEVEAIPHAEAARAEASASRTTCSTSSSRRPWQERSR